MPSIDSVADKIGFTESPDELDITNRRLILAIAGWAKNVADPATPPLTEGDEDSPEEEPEPDVMAVVYRIRPKNATASIPDTTWTLADLTPMLRTSLKKAYSGLSLPQSVSSALLITPPDIQGNVFLIGDELSHGDLNQMFQLWAFGKIQYS